MFTAAQFLRRWFSDLTQTVTQTWKNQLELSTSERMMLWKFPSGKLRKCLEMSLKNTRPTFGTKRPRVRIPTLRPEAAGTAAAERGRDASALWLRHAIHQSFRLLWADGGAGKYAKAHRASEAANVHRYRTYQG